MDIDSPIAMESCPRCHSEPRIVRKMRYKVRCACGACGPETRTAEDAARRWRSVAHYMRKHEAVVGEMLQLAVPGVSPPPPGFDFTFEL